MAYYFVQHGIALAKEQDIERPLSPEGRVGVLSVVKHLKQCNISLNTICHSGKMRALQTAEIFAETLAVENVVALDGMNPADDVETFASTLEDEDVMYIGHLPHIAKLVSYLVTGDENSAVVKFSNAVVVCIERDEHGYHIKWVMSPEMC
jgi:phosphohistidine phosphatase